MTTAQLDQAFDQVGLATESLAQAAIEEPEIRVLLVQLAESTARFAKAIAAGREAARFLSKPRMASYAKKLASSEDFDYAWNCYNFMDATKQSLKVCISKTFRQCDVDEHYAKFPIADYRKFFKAFKRQVKVDCKDKDVVKAIHQYADATLHNLQEALKK